MRTTNIIETPQYLTGVAPSIDASEEIRSLTGLRGVAAVWVVLFHMVVHDPGSGLIDAMIKHGYLAVDLFFVLSGFVMAMSYRRIFTHPLTGKTFCVFMLRRIARIYPLYIFVLLLVSTRLIGQAFLTHGPARSLLTDLPFNIFLIQAWVGRPSILGPSWSVSTEFAAYFLFPLLLKSVTSRSQVLPALTVLLAGCGVLAVACHSTTDILSERHGPLDLSDGAPFWPLLRCMAEFTLGLVSYRAATSRLFSRRTESRTVTRFGLSTRTCIDLAIGLALICAIAIPRSDIVFVALLPPLMIALSARNGALSTIFSARPIYMFGLWSYAIYLWHFPLLFIMWHAEALLQARIGFDLARAVGVVACWAVILPVSALSYRFIETPGRKIIRGFEKRLFPSEDRAVLESEAAGRARL
ncbi:putative acyltransferase [Acetobacter nitrogenifigens DSM 23921 = NBRC 105050]|uniref:Acyltransferase n=1 Tax=Acetobacter nitrogenifigens DSM 23921 = NBRC 105050 TaxID=1120919 RepID=A0A511XBF6_9PROT|nr:acyltransferase [Acetobacter nitrogenifigens]GBQ93076.1 putative acyltransferase [Acetobacter nitrogenifigens DSM 23921 = NBRC 105050]GEN60211.1 acyltransferase [Acetobacter nitrogenifigens DSM 23921 = NBRC 105050]